MVADPLGRFAYVANLVSNASDLSTISMYTINSTTGASPRPHPPLSPPDGFPRESQSTRSDDSSTRPTPTTATVSMFTINQTTGVLTPTTPASVSTLIPGEPFRSQAS
jgi:6-phosphogluconolactonase